jgi:hypothetical protein
MKSHLYGLVGTCEMVYIYLLDKMPLMSSPDRKLHPMRVSTMPFFGRNEL